MKYLFPLLLGIVHTLCAQPTIAGLINAEQSFAEFTSAHTVREGFLAYMDTAGVVFNRGTAYNALQFHQSQPARPGILNWEPAFAVINVSGNWGATTGPYTYRVSAADTPVSKGSFLSVWHHTEKNGWKNMADLGVGYALQYPSPVVNDIEKIIAKGSAGVVTASPGSLDSLFNTALQEHRTETFSTLLHVDNLLNIDGQPPLRGTKCITALQQLPQHIQLKTLFVQLADSDDLAYTYGTVTNGKMVSNYLRVWIRQDNRWKIILQTCRW
jgi:hypothetical protein